MPGTLHIEQRLRLYSGTGAEIQQAINQELARTDAWFIREMGFNQSGAGIVAWVLWELQTRA
jgi:hypothetical protein